MAGGWGGGIYMGAQKQFYKSRAWRRARAAYIEHRISIDGGMCEVCHERPGKIVHHKDVWLNDSNCNDPDIALCFNNFRYDCQTCHNKEQDPSKHSSRRVEYTENGEVLKQGEY